MCSMGFNTLFAEHLNFHIFTFSLFQFLADKTLTHEIIFSVVNKLYLL